MRGPSPNTLLRRVVVTRVCVLHTAVGTIIERREPRLTVIVIDTVSTAAYYREDPPSDI